MLQPVNKSMLTYVKDSYAFKKRVDTVRLCFGSWLFTADVVSMYTNIDTNKDHLPIPTIERRHFNQYDAATLIRAIKIVMRNNIVMFGDTCAKKIKDTAMGKTLIQPGPAHLEESKKSTTSQPGHRLSRSTSDILTILKPPDHLPRTLVQPTPMDYEKTSKPKSTWDALPGSSVNEVSPSNSWT